MITREASTREEVGVARCATCGAARSGTYCAQCGERAIEPGELSVRHFVAETLSTVTALDGRLLRSFWLLLRRPGMLTKEFLAGRRVPYIRPIQLFLIANLVYFVVQPFTHYTGYNSSLASQMDRQIYSETLRIRSVVEGAVAAEGISMELYKDRFDRHSAVLARSLVFVMVPLLAIVLALLLAYRRLPFGPHLVFATHYYAFDLVFVGSLFLFCWSALLRFLARYAGLSAYALQSLDGLPGVIGMALVELPTFFVALPYLYLAARRAYDLPRHTALAVAAGLGLALLPIMLVYRLALFWITYATL